MTAGPGGRRAAVLGSPIAHSLSPVLHRTAYASLGLDDWRYDAYEVGDAETLAQFVGRCDASWAGLSLTMPLKRLVQPLLTEVSEVARATGSVNTVVFAAAGPVGDNTDVEGLVRALQEAGAGRADRPVLLGGGATAASAVAALGQLRGPGTADGEREPVRVVVRAPERAAQVVAAAGTLGVPVELVSWGGATQALRGADVLVSTVPASGQGAVTEAVGAAGTVAGLLLDVTYDPWPTPAATAWQHAGGTATGGFAMLLHQAVAQVRLMTGLRPDVEAMRAAGLAALHR